MSAGSDDAVDSFLSSGRTGRRNALPDILDERYIATGSGDLAVELDKLSCSEQITGPSGGGQTQPSTPTAAN